MDLDCLARLDARSARADRVGFRGRRLDLDGSGLAVGVVHSEELGNEAGERACRSRNPRARVSTQAHVGTGAGSTHARIPVSSTG